MKAVKLTKINWNLNNLTEEERVNAMRVLPTHKGFKADDSFVILDKVPTLLKKKYGYDIIDFCFTEIPIIDDVTDLLKFCAPEGKEKPIYTEAGRLSTYGKMCKENLERLVKERIQMERKGVSEYDMPKKLDAVMLAIQEITKLDWEAHTPDELLAPIYRKIWDQRAYNLKDAFEMSECEEGES